MPCGTSQAFPLGGRIRPVIPLSRGTNRGGGQRRQPGRTESHMRANIAAMCFVPPMKSVSRMFSFGAW